MNDEQVITLFQNLNVNSSIPDLEQALALFLKYPREIRRLIEVRGCQQLVKLLIELLLREETKTETIKLIHYFLARSGDYLFLFIHEPLMQSAQALFEADEVTEQARLRFEHFGSFMRNYHMAWEGITHAELMAENKATADERVIHRGVFVRDLAMLLHLFATHGQQGFIMEWLSQMNEAQQDDITIYALQDIAMLHISGLSQRNPQLFNSAIRADHELISLLQRPQSKEVILAFFRHYRRFAPPFIMNLILERNLLQTHSKISVMSEFAGINLWQIFEMMYKHYDASGAGIGSFVNNLICKLLNDQFDDITASDLWWIAEELGSDFVDLTDTTTIDYLSLIQQRLRDHWHIETGEEYEDDDTIDDEESDE